ncbi:MAG: hypothetical protein ACXWBN_09640 [Acidimicrobiales bacterium]
MNHDDDLARLRRQLRAMAAVNEHLRVQLDALRATGATTGTAPVRGAMADPPPPPPRLRSAARRSEIAGDWVPALVADAPERRAGDPVVVSRDDRAVYVIEGTVRRRLTITLLAPALEQLYGERRPIGDDEFHGLTEGPPIEVLEGPTGAPFVIVGGRRLTVRGLGLPHGVDQTVVDALPEGPQLDVAAAVVPRRALAAADWVGPLVDLPPEVEAHLGVTPDGTTIVVDGRLRRPVRARLLLPALETALGPRRPIAEAELEALDEGPPVELLEGRAGLPFVVVGGRRLPVTGLPLPFPIERSALDTLPQGPTLDTATALLPRRANAAGPWLAQLSVPAPDRSAEVVTRPDGSVHVRDGACFRKVTSGLLLAALEERYGTRRPATEAELAEWTEGPPVEILEARTGVPFLVVGGVRLPVRNLPLPNPIGASTLDGLPEGAALDIAKAQRGASRAGGSKPAGPGGTAGKLKDLVGKEGVVRATAQVIRRKPEGQ